MNFLEQFAPGQRSQLLAAAWSQVLDPGTHLFSRGDEAEMLLVVESGELAVVDTRARPEVVLDVAGPGAVIGDIAFLIGVARTADVRVTRPGTARAWPFPALRALLAADPTLGARFYQVLAEVGAHRARALGKSIAVGHERRERQSSVNEGDHDLDGLVYMTEAACAAAAAGGPREAVGHALVRIAETLGRLEGSPQEAVTAERLRERLADRLAGSRLATLLLARPAGELPSIAANARLGELGRGADPGASALDLALFDLPLFSGTRWRSERLAARAAGSPRALVLPAGGAAMVLAAADPGRHCVVDGDPRLAELARYIPVNSLTLRVRPLSMLVAGRQRPAVGQGTVVVDGLVDLVPDRLAPVVLRWAAESAGAGGEVIVGHALPSDDTPLVAHLLRTPVIGRRTASVDAIAASVGLTRESGEVHPAAAVTAYRVRA